MPRNITRKITCAIFFVFFSGPFFIAHALADAISAPYQYIEDGQFSKELHIPTYEWLPTTGSPQGIVVAVHGLTLHGKRYEVFGRTCAAGGYYCVAADMRGFGRWRTDSDHHFGTGNDRGQKVNYEKSFDDLVTLVRLAKKKYPNLDVVVVGESLGATVGVRLAGEHPELVDGLVLSGTPVKLNPLIFFYPENIKAGLYAALISPHFHLNLKVFESRLVSNDPKIIEEMISDPLVLKHMPLSALLETQNFCAKTSRYARGIRKNLPILFLVASEDRCVVPNSVTDLTRNISSVDQTMRWLNGYGHLLLETAYIRAGTVDALVAWLRQHEEAHTQEVKKTEEIIHALGGKATD